MFAYSSDWYAPTFAMIYVVMGISTSATMIRRGQRLSLALPALVCWPLLLGLLQTEWKARLQGPLHEAITHATQNLRTALSEPGAAGLVESTEIEMLEESMLKADARIATVDRLLQEQGTTQISRIQDGYTQLAAARARAFDELQAVIDGTVQLRLQIGLRSLAGSGPAVQDRMLELEARVRALSELSSWEAEISENS